MCVCRDKHGQCERSCVNQILYKSSVKQRKNHRHACNRRISASLWQLQHTVRTKRLCLRALYRDSSAALCSVKNNMFS
jgi:hypothetical protein